MNYLLVLVAIVLVFQIVLFFLIRKLNKKLKSDSVIHKYNLKSPADAFKILNDPNIPEKDREEIEILYKGSLNDD